MKFGTIVAEVNVHWMTESDFLTWHHTLKMASMTSLWPWRHLRRKVLLPGEWTRCICEYTSPWSVVMLLLSLLLIYTRVVLTFLLCGWCVVFSTTAFIVSCDWNLSEELSRLKISRSSRFINILQKCLPTCRVHRQTPSYHRRPDICLCACKLLLMQVLFLCFCTLCWVF